MAHWSECYIGRAWTPDFDCVDLIELVLLEQFGRDITFPARVPDRTKQPAQLDQLAGDYGTRIDIPRDGDIVIINSMLGTDRTGFHLGLFCRIGGTSYTLHSTDRLGVMLTRIDQLANAGLAVEGFYRLHSAAI